MIEFLTIFYNYITTLLFIDFSNYTGNLPTEFLEMYGYFASFFKLLVIFYFLYLCFNFVLFLVSLGGVRHDK